MKIEIELKLKVKKKIGWIADLKLKLEIGLFNL